VSEFRTLSAHVDMFTPDDRTDRPALGAVHGERGTLLVEGGASTAHLGAFVAELAQRGRPPVEAIVLTHWHWDHSFGSAAVDVPVIAHRSSAEELERQAAYDWSDEALDERVAAGTELGFCRDMMKLEMPDRSGLRIVVPSVIVDERHVVELGGATAVVEHVGGDHAPDSLAVYVPEDRVIFLGDCLYQRLHAPVEHLTVAGVWALTDRLARYDVAVAVEGHNDDPEDAAGFAARLAALRFAADLVERYGEGAVAHAGGDEDVEEAIGFLLAGGEKVENPGGVLSEEPPPVG
jgi:glyoxylase-like metal-dependent hydrolase (beta-lactamase superfamily II)